MPVAAEQEGNTVIAHLSGRVEGGTSATEFQEALQGAIGPTSQAMVLDFEHLDYISSAGLRAIAILLNDTRKRGVRLLACRMKAPVRAVFEVSGFDQLIRVHETRDQAFQAATEVK